MSLPHVIWIGPCHHHMPLYSRSTKRGKKLRIGNNIKKLNVGFVELQKCGGKEGR